MSSFWWCFGFSDEACGFFYLFFFGVLPCLAFPFCIWCMVTLDTKYPCPVREGHEQIVEPDSSRSCNDEEKALKKATKLAQNTLDDEKKKKQGTDIQPC